jgi:hypothetical protein
MNSSVQNLNSKLTLLSLIINFLKCEKGVYSNLLAVATQTLINRSLSHGLPGNIYNLSDTISSFLPLLAHGNLMQPAALDRCNSIFIGFHDFGNSLPRPVGANMEFNFTPSLELFLLNYRMLLLVLESCKTRLDAL